jgi:large subunit ribosomal protein L21
MNDYAVIQIAHRQYIVEPGKTYTVDKFEAEPGSKLKLPALAKGKDKTFEIGKPQLDKSNVEIEILDQLKGDKISTFTYKAKSRYRRRHGLRQRITTFKVLKIS